MAALLDPSVTRQEGAQLFDEGGRRIPIVCWGCRIPVTCWGSLSGPVDRAADFCPKGARRPSPLDENDYSRAAPERRALACASTLRSAVRCPCVHGGEGRRARDFVERVRKIVGVRRRRRIPIICWGRRIP